MYFFSIAWELGSPDTHHKDISPLLCPCRNVAAALWGVPGVIISAKGVKAYMLMPAHSLWWLMLITAQPQKTSLWHTFPLRGWALIIFMLCLGISLKFIPGLPMEFTASFYSGLGPMLLFAAFRFMFNHLKNR